VATIAVTGATGFVGGTVAAVLAGKGHDVVCLVRRAVELPWPSRLVDVGDSDAIARGLEGCDAVAHLAILNDFHGMYADRKAAQDGYVGLTRRVVDAANLTGARVAYVSTDWVFDGTGHLVDEEEPPNPVNFYGFMKAASELVVLERARAGFVARVGGVQGLHQTQVSGPRSQDVGFGYFVLSLVDALRAGGRFLVWEDPDINSYATPIVSPEIGALLSRAVERGSAASCTSPAARSSHAGSWPSRPARSSGSMPPGSTSAPHRTRPACRRRCPTTRACRPTARWPCSAPRPTPSKPSSPPSRSSSTPVPRRRSAESQGRTRWISKL
jgi:dTDP-4-dehydrorhamnose reductase